MTNNVKNIFYEVIEQCKISINSLPLPEIVIENACSGIDKIRIQECLEAEALHRKKWRQFCHTMHRKNVICCVKDMNNLKDENIAGLLFHEIAHIISEQHYDIFYQDSGLYVEKIESDFHFYLDDENVDHEIFADAIAERILNARIYYNEDKIQWVSIDWR